MTTQWKESKLHVPLRPDVLGKPKQTYQIAWAGKNKVGAIEYGPRMTDDKGTVTYAYWAQHFLSGVNDLGCFDTEAEAKQAVEEAVREWFVKSGVAIGGAA